MRAAVHGHPGPRRSLSPGCKATVAWHGWVPCVPPGRDVGLSSCQRHFYNFSVLGSSWFGSFSALTEGLVLLWFPCVGESQGVLGGGLCPVGSAMGQHVSAKFPGEGMTEICWPGRNAAVTKQLGWASQWRWLQSCATWGHLCHHRHSLLCYAGLAKDV